MKQQTYIVSNWSQEVKAQQQQQVQSKQDRYNALQEFKSSVCDLFDMADFYYYAELIGCKVSYLLNIALYSDSEQYKRYHRRQRDIDHRYQFYINNGHSITKQNPLFN
jgi:hypothetical protein